MALISTSYIYDITVIVLDILVFVFLFLFCKYLFYNPKYLQIFAEEEQKYKHQNIEDTDSNVTNIESGNKRHLLLLPYQGEQGSRLVKSLKRSITKLLSEATQLELGFTSSKLSMHFQIKDKTEFEHNHDIVYLGTCPQNNC